MWFFLAQVNTKSLCGILPPVALWEPFREVTTGITTSTSTFGKAASRGLTWCWQPTWFSATAFLTRNSNMSGDASTTEEGSLWTALHT